MDGVQNTHLAKHSLPLQTPPSQAIQHLRSIVTEVLLCRMLLLTFSKCYRLSGLKDSGNRDTGKGQNRWKAATYSARPSWSPRRPPSAGYQRMLKEDLTLGNQSCFQHLLKLEHFHYHWWKILTHSPETLQAGLLVCILVFEETFQVQQKWKAKSTHFARPFWLPQRPLSRATCRPPGTGQGWSARFCRPLRAAWQPPLHPTTRPHETEHTSRIKRNRATSS